jgi:hypothetical protein
MFLPIHKLTRKVSLFCSETEMKFVPASQDITKLFTWLLLLLETQKGKDIIPSVTV